MPIRTIDIGKPNKKQVRFFQSRAKHTGFGGARGGGKSWAVRSKAKMLAFRYSGIAICIARRTFPELTVNHINILRQELNGIVRYNDRDKIMYFPNGSTIQFRYCATDSDLMGWQGSQYDVLFLDEATNFTEFQIMQMIACVRGTNPDFPRRIYYTCNPGGPGHNLIKRWFIDRKYEKGENPDDFVFIQSLVTDNDALMSANSDYIKQLEMLPEHLKKGWLYGEWNCFSGQFFEEFRDDPEHYFDRKWSHVIEPFDIPSHWNVYRSYDYGYAKPFSFGYYAVSDDGTVYRIAELYGCTGEPNEGVKWTADEQFAKAHEFEQQHPYLQGKQINGTADPAIFHADGGESIYECAIRHQIYFTPGDNSRIQGWMQMHNRMAFDENGKAMFYVFNTCKHFIRTIPLLQYSKTHIEDLDTTQEDHIADECRYFCMSRPIAPRTTEVKKELGDDPLNQRVKETNPKTNVYKYTI